MKFKKPVAIALTVLLLMLMASCGNNAKSSAATEGFSKKTPLSPEEFTEKIEAELYGVFSEYVTDEMPEGIRESIRAIRYDRVEGNVFFDKNGKDVIAEYYLIEDENTAKTLFEDAISVWKDQGWSCERKDSGNFTYCVMTGDGEVRIAARVEDTMISVSCGEDFKEEAEALLEKLGYK